MPDSHKRLAFEHLVLPHLDAAHNLARWLVGHPHDAQELAQDAVVRAWRHFDTFRGGSARAWLLTIVRHTCYDWMHRKGAYAAHQFDEQSYTGDGTTVSAANVTMGQSPEAILLNRLEGELVRQELARLPLQFREVLILREIEGFTYHEIAEIADVPPGTVMSRLSRARRLLQERLTQRLSQEPAA